MDASIPREVGNPRDPDSDPLETREWIESLDALIEAEGPERATFLLRRLLPHARLPRAAPPADVGWDALCHPRRPGGAAAVPGQPRDRVAHLEPRALERARDGG